MSEVTAPPKFVLSYSHNVIEHLGLKLYQNKPANVIAELVSNSWDADARNVAIAMEMDQSKDRYVSVSDDGHGMTRDEVVNNFLVIGAPKRSTPEQRSRGGKRSLMGRKGIGKLAPFGIADVVEVCSVAKSGAGRSCVWIRLELQEIKKFSKPGRTSVYDPIVICDGDLPSDAILAKEDRTGEVAKCLSALGTGPGTVVLMRNLTIGKAIGTSQLVQSLGRRLSATLLGSFHVKVNGERVEAKTVLPDFDFRIPESGFSTELVGEREVRYWVGFVKEASWPADEAGVGVFAHGKICQGRPFTFGSKGKEIYTRYMYASVEADWLDELSEDLISTDRNSTNWDAEAAKPLYDWGRNRVSQWVGKFEQWREKEEVQENRTRVKKAIADGKAPSLSAQEQDRVAELLAKITPSLGKDEDGKELLARSISSAWIQEPMRDLVKQLWSEFGKEGKSVPHVFSGLVEKLVAYSVPESLNLALVFAQRAFALTKLFEFVHTGQEVDLQRLLQDFPWIIEPDRIFLTANQALKTVVLEAEKEGLFPQPPKKKVVAGVPESNKPDFVFLSSPDEADIVVVELKNPQQDLTIENREQLYSYMVFLEAHYPNAHVRGYLVGRTSKPMNMPREDSELLPWTEVLKRARSRYVTFLAAMLASIPDENVKLNTVRDFAGPEVWELLKKLAAKSPKLEGLISSYSNQ
jgi:hypothetical protein